MKVWFVFVCISVFYGADILRTLWLLQRQSAGAVKDNVQGEYLLSLFFRALQIIIVTGLLVVVVSHEQAEFVFQPYVRLIVIVAAVFALALQGIVAVRLVMAKKIIDQPGREAYVFPTNARFDEEWTKNPQYYDLNGLQLRMLALPNWQTEEQDFQDSHIVLEGAIMLSVLSGNVTWTRASKAFDITLTIFEEMDFRSEWAKLISDSTRITASTSETNKGASKRYPELIEKMECFLVIGTMSKISAKLAQPFAPAVYRRVKIFDNTEKAIFAALRDFIPQRHEKQNKVAAEETVNVLPSGYHEQRIMEIYTMLAKISDPEPNTIEVPDIPADDMYYDVFRAMSVVNDDKRRQMDTLLMQQEMLQVQGAEIQEANTMLSERLEQLNEQNRQLEQFNHEKIEIMGIVSHDLKNPIGALRNFGEMIQQQIIPDEKMPEVASTIVLTADRMLELVKNLLDINRLEQGAMNIQMVKLSVSMILDSILWRYQPIAEVKNIQIHVLHGNESHDVLADEQLIMQVLENLLSNAIKFSPFNKNVYIRTVGKTDTVRIEIQDEGPGVSADDMTRLFEKFTRLSAQPTGGEHSTGLGLSIVKKMVDVMNGNVWCESEKGQGATFIVELPVVHT